MLLIRARGFLDQFDSDSRAFRGGMVTAGGHMGDRMGSGTGSGTGRSRPPGTEVEPPVEAVSHEIGFVA
jgi:hypothetical protein